MALLHEQLTDQILKCFFKVHNYLGTGFLEKVYENALMIELRDSGLECYNQQRIKVYYNEKIVGDYYADIIVENKVILEIKIAEEIIPAHEAQLINYLKATKVEVGLVLNFGSKPSFSRKVLTNDKK
jgi:GxxExxY protein